MSDLTIGNFTVTDVVLAPMAGVTNPPFRRLCREAGELGAREAGYEGISGLYVCEMVTTRALVERHPETMRMIEPDPEDPIRSIQLYGVEPKTVGAAVRILADEDRADHIDLNFGCPVPKVTRKGGGAALPWKLDLFTDIVTAAVENSGGIPVTVKTRIGIDADHHTYLDAGRIAQDAGISAMTLHGRTMTQHYAGHADWDAIASLVDALDIPVLGNGDLFSADDAQAMREHTGCAGIVVGRGCQGRPWIFTDLVAQSHGSTVRARPSFRDVASIIRRHAEYSIDHFGDELRAMREMRKHITWYLRGFSVGGEGRRDLALVSTLAELDDRLAAIPDQDYPEAADGPRGRAGTEKKSHLPEFWLDSRQLSAEQSLRIQAAEVDTSGG
ncbi:tRNA dihydrouridine synthase DusB [Flaviflexus equikiangi]|uniref:tRNA dihydrouridine synthase DusB n=1 Tax=Flaviflexus equikiangi TaxID=2758573 RepID=UPI0015F5288E|nr:tRNA dihydrouridine synthase DusB [Flaviflexus equikiangi]